MLLGVDGLVVVGRLAIIAVGETDTTAESEVPISVESGNASGVVEKERDDDVMVVFENGKGMTDGEPEAGSGGRAGDTEGSAMTCTTVNVLDIGAELVMSSDRAALPLRIARELASASLGPAVVSCASDTSTVE